MLDLLEQTAFSSYGDRCIGYHMTAQFYSKHSTQAYAPRMAPPLRHAITRWAIAYPYCMRAHLLRHPEGTLTLELLLTPEECSWLADSAHTPCAAAAYMSHLLARGVQDSILLADLNMHVDNLVLYSGVCERLIASPIPVAYSRYVLC
jgi:predicted membrane chloride channel (bestrophin family)